jgi:uncharacterized protein YceH (UPF0502 family)
MTELILTPAEARVLASLVEKATTTPQYYPMTVNAITLAANQKSSRHPLMNLSEGDTGAALNALERHSLVRRDDFSGRVPKWRQQFAAQMLLKPPVAAVLATLMLRGAQTVAELRSNASALSGPDDAGVAAALADLADRAQPLVVQLPRAPGQAATRYAHTLCGVPEASTTVGSVERIATPARRESETATMAALEARIAALEARLAALEGQLL